jgi:hypothetical protein
MNENTITLMFLMVFMLCFIGLVLTFLAGKAAGHPMDWDDHGDGRPTAREEHPVLILTLFDRGDGEITCGIRTSTDCDHRALTLAAALMTARAVRAMPHGVEGGLQVVQEAAMQVLEAREERT